jgi:hypothetical protein
MLGGAALLTAGLIGAGCGGGDDTTTASGASGATGAQGAALTKTEFVAQANAICAKGNKAIDQAAKQTFGNSRPSGSQLNQFATETLIPNVQDQIDEVKALPPPSGDEAQVSEILTAAQGALDKIKADPALLTGSGPSPFASANKLAKEYGLTECASD